MKNLLFYALAFMVMFPSALFSNSNKIIVNEFMAVNSNSILDGDEAHSDWIELYNNTAESVDLAGWYLTDKADNLIKWKFPSVVIPKGGYLIIFASEKDTVDGSGYLHTNFKLSGSGEFLAVCEPDSTISSSYSPAFAAQRQDVSFGLYQGQEVYFTQPTPGFENLASDLPFIPNFSQTRGFFNTAFDVELTAPNSGAAIYYTIDGTIPTKSTGTLYTAPIHISKTTPVSAVVVDGTNQSSAVVSNTYWFVTDILKQPVAPSGYPTDWDKAGSSTDISADYEMDPEVCFSTDYKDDMEAALTLVPSMNIVTSRGYLFSDVKDDVNGGIYIFTGKPSGDGRSWVRPTSIEYFDPATGKEFQANCRLKLHGGNSRNPSNSAKHGFELAFTSSYGPSKLNFNLFEEKSATNEFNSLVLRSGYNYSWTLLSDFYASHFTQRENAQYLQDPWAKTTQLAMGKTSGHQRFVHLYINGLYWGLYNVAEEYTNDFMESYMKGDETEFDIIKEKQEATSGTIDAFNQLVEALETDLSSNSNYQKLQGNSSDGTVNPSYPNLLDVDNYIDYMLLNYYIGNQDWNKNNWTMVRNRTAASAGFRFLSWDAETSMVDVNTDLVSESTDDKNPADFIKFLIENKDFKVLLADRIQKHMIASGGALTPSEVTDRYIKLASIIDKPIIAESARWGDANAANILYTKNDYWVPRKQDLMDNYFPVRTDIVVGQLRRNGYFPSVNAPVFTHYGGTISSAINLGMSSNKGDIYYTTDGSDPRISNTAAVASTATKYADLLDVASSMNIRARAKSGSEWSAITKAKFNFDPSNGVDMFSASGLEIGGHPNPFTSYTNIHITLPIKGDLKVDIYTVDGRFVSNLFNSVAMCGENEVLWQTQSEPAGVYVCHIMYRGKIYYLKLIKR